MPPHPDFDDLKSITYEFIAEIAEVSVRSVPDSHFMTAIADNMKTG
jgi:hypothetical protein